MWAVLKRSIYGTWHHVSGKHLSRYVNEATFRLNEGNVQRRYFLRGLATIGIIGLVDEATGYERIREERALAKILEKFLDDELQPWTRTFEYSFYLEIFRLKGWGSVVSVKRPQVIGHYTNDLVYDRIAPGVLAELRERNPVLTQGWRKNRHHQWFTPEFGHPKLRMHIEGVTALMRASGSWESFKRALNRAYPKLDTQLSMPEEE